MTTKAKETRRRWVGAGIDVGAAVGRAIGKRRANAGLSQRELGELSSSSKETIAKVESGEQVCPLWLLFSCAEALKCEAWELLKEATERAEAA